MAAFGEELRRQREERGIPLETLCSATKVSERHIRALEAGAFGELPGGVFRRGFLRSYLNAVGLDEALWMKRFEESCREAGVVDPADAEWATFAENVKNSRVVLHRRMRMRWAAVLAALLALAIAAWCGWRVAVHKSVVPSTAAWPHWRSRFESPFRK